MKKSLIRNEARNVIMLLIASLFSFGSLHIFVMPSNFSPSGIDGISTILYELTDINIGWFKLLFNLPLMILAWIYLNKKHVLYVTIFTLMDSVGVILLESIGFYTFIPGGLNPAEEVGYRLIAAIFSGVALGVCTGLMLKVGASTGGIDIIASLINMKFPHFHIERLISIICYCIIGCSYFVYWDLTSILLSIIQIFVFEWTTATLLKRERFAFEVKVITKEPEKLKNDILYKFEHSATIVEATGMYSGDDYAMVITVLDSKNTAECMNLMKQYPDTFMYLTDGVKVQGDFHFGKDTLM